MDNKKEFEEPKIMKKLLKLTIFLNLFFCSQINTMILKDVDDFKENAPTNDDYIFIYAQKCRVIKCMILAMDEGIALTEAAEHALRFKNYEEFKPLEDQYLSKRNVFIAEASNELEKLEKIIGQTATEIFRKEINNFSQKEDRKGLLNIYRKYYVKLIECKPNPKDIRDLQNPKLLVISKYKNKSTPGIFMKSMDPIDSLFDAEFKRKIDKVKVCCKETVRIFLTIVLKITTKRLENEKVKDEIEDLKIMLSDLEKQQIQGCNKDDLNAFISYIKRISQYEDKWYVLNIHNKSYCYLKEMNPNYVKNFTIRIKIPID